ncbi:Heat shock cognate 70 kDa protein 2, partial [Mucuna pruriens]
MDKSGNPRALRKLRTACEKAKRTLSSAIKTIIEVDSLYKGIDFFLSMSRAKFEELNKEHFNKCMEIVERCVMDAKIDKSSIDDVVLVGGSSRIPKVRELLRDLFDGKNLCTRVHVDEAVAYGAAVHASRLSGEFNEKLQNTLLREVTPLSLGTKTAGDIMEIIIPRNTSIPIKMESEFTTCCDNQATVLIGVYEGERQATRDNNLLGEFRLEIPPAPQGVPKIIVCFELDDDGILHVSAKEKSMGITKKMIITNEKGRLSKEEIERIILEADKYKVEDEMYRKKVEARQALEKYAFNIKHVIKNKKVILMLSPEDKGKISDAIDDYTCQWLEANEDAKVEDVDYMMNNLSTVLDLTIMNMIKGEDYGVPRGVKDNITGIVSAIIDN